MLTVDQKNEFSEKGYLLIPNVFPTDKMIRLRRDVEHIFSTPLGPGDIPRKGNAAEVRLQVFSRYPELRWLLTHPPVVAALRSLLGDDFVFLPETALQDSGFGGWHKDTSSQERAGHKFQWQPDFRMIQVAVYLQDNNEYGGGLDVVPGSHRRPDFFANNGLRERWGRLRAALDEKGFWPCGYSVPSRVGDLVLFDVRLEHRATFPRVKTPPPPGARKLSLFMQCSANNRFAQNYRDFLTTRPVYGYLKGHAYPHDLLAYARDHGIHLMP